jgi:hypothetical protein
MEPLLLCEEPARLVLKAHGARVLLDFESHGNVSLHLGRAELSDVLAGDTIQVSHRGSHVRLDREGNNIHASFSTKGCHGRCTFPAAQIEEFLASLPSEEKSAL